VAEKQEQPEQQEPAATIAADEAEARQAQERSEPLATETSVAAAQPHSRVERFESFEAWRAQAAHRLRHAILSAEKKTEADSQAIATAFKTPEAQAARQSLLKESLAAETEMWAEWCEREGVENNPMRWKSHRAGSAILSLALSPELRQHGELSEAIGQRWGRNPMEIAETLGADAFVRAKDVADENPRLVHSPSLKRLFGNPGSFLDAMASRGEQLARLGLDPRLALATVDERVPQGALDDPATAADVIKRGSRSIGFSMERWRPRRLASRQEWGRRAASAGFDSLAAWVGAGCGVAEGAAERMAKETWAAQETSLAKIGDEPGRWGISLGGLMEIEVEGERWRARVNAAETLLLPKEMHGMAGGAGEGLIPNVEGMAQLAWLRESTFRHRPARDEASRWGGAPASWARDIERDAFFEKNEADKTALAQEAQDILQRLPDAIPSDARQVAFNALCVALDQTLLAAGRPVASQTARRVCRLRDEESWPDVAANDGRAQALSKAFVGALDWMGKEPDLANRLAQESAAGLLALQVAFAKGWPLTERVEQQAKAWLAELGLTDAGWRLLRRMTPEQGQNLSWTLAGLRMRFEPIVGPDGKDVPDYPDHEGDGLVGKTLAKPLGQLARAGLAPDEALALLGRSEAARPDEALARRLQSVHANAVKSLHLGLIMGWETPRDETGAPLAPPETTPQEAEKMARANAELTRVLGRWAKALAGAGDISAKNGEKEKKNWESSRDEQLRDLADWLADNQREKLGLPREFGMSALRERHDQWALRAAQEQAKRDAAEGARPSERDIQRSLVAGHARSETEIQEAAAQGGWTMAVGEVFGDAEGQAADPSAEGAPAPEWAAIGLASVVALGEEGAAMSHCVGSYVPKCVSGRSRVFRVEQNGQSVGTLELSTPAFDAGVVLGKGQDLSWKVAQFRGKRNAAIESSAAWAFAKEVARLYTEAAAEKKQEAVASGALDRFGERLDAQRAGAKALPGGGQNAPGLLARACRWVMGVR
jgi:hypothetical protein